jgi:hypothetical protein
VHTFFFLVAFFRAAPPVTRPIVMALCAAAGAGCGAMAAGLVPSRTVLTPILVLQIFAASSGFDLALRRGFYDLVLARGVPAPALLVAHWIASIAPGVAIWLAVAAIERMVSNTSPSALTSGSLVALGLASSLPWALTTPLPRFAAAIGWLMLLVTSLAVVPSGQADLVGALRSPHASAVGALAVVAYPMALIGLDATDLPAGTLGPGLLCAIASAAGALLWHRRTRAPLETIA